jgi:PAS domain S-box-containing protein
MDHKPSYEELEQTIRDLEARLEHSQQFLNDILNYIPDLIFVKDERHRWVLLNDAFCSALGHTREELLGKTDYDFHTKEQADVFWEKDNLVFNTQGTNVNEEVYTDPEGYERTILTSKAAFRDEQGKKLLVGVAHDISERKRAEQDRERLIAELQEALSKVRTLSGLLPICAFCKKIRDDKGYWRQIESYLSTHTNAEVSHSLCQECAARLYGNEPWYRGQKK